MRKNTPTPTLTDKNFAKRDTSYASLWLYNKLSDLNSVDLKDKFVNFYDEKELMSEFNPNIAKNIISFWSNRKDLILDPFAGRTRALVAFAMDRRYIGYDISKDTYQYIINRFDELKLFGNPNFMVDIRNQDCLTIKDDFKGECFDMVFSCPPYHNIEKYQSCEGQLSDIKDYGVFLEELKKRLDIAVSVLKKGGYMCLVVGDFRKNGCYVTFHADLIRAMRSNPNITLHDVIVIQNIPFVTAAFYFGSKRKFKYTAKTHEYLLVWKRC